MSFVARQMDKIFKEKIVVDKKNLNKKESGLYRYQQPRNSCLYIYIFWSKVITAKALTKTTYHFFLLNGKNIIKV